MTNPLSTEKKRKENPRINKATPIFPAPLADITAYNRRQCSSPSQPPTTYSHTEELSEKMEEGRSVAPSSVEIVVELEKEEKVAVRANAEMGIKDDHEVDSSQDDPWFDDSDGEVDGTSSMDREWHRRREHFYNAGYRDGISAGKNDAAQDGFNQGFKESVMVGCKWGTVRGITSALAHLPNELLVKLVEKEEVRREILKLHETVESIGTEDALKLFFEDIQKVRAAEQESKLISGSSASQNNTSEQNDLESHFGKLDLLLQQSPALDIHMGSN